MAWLINLSALVVDVVPKPSLATTFGVVAAGSSIGGMMMNKGVGWLVTHHSYAPAFYLMAILHPLAWCSCGGCGRAMSERHFCFLMQLAPPVSTVNRTRCASTPIW